MSPAPARPAGRPASVAAARRLRVAASAAYPAPAAPPPPPAIPLLTPSSRVISAPPRARAAELKSVMEKCGVPMTTEAVAEIIKEFDADRDGSLNFQEFVSLMNKMMSGPTEKDIRKSMFEVFDGNMDGYISLAEVSPR